MLLKEVKDREIDRKLSHKHIPKTDKQMKIFLLLIKATEFITELVIDKMIESDLNKDHAMKIMINQFMEDLKKAIIKTMTTSGEELLIVIENHSRGIDTELLTTTEDNLDKEDDDSKSNYGAEQVIDRKKEFDHNRDHVMKIMIG